MWIPYGLSAPLKAETSRATVEASERDSGPRPMLIGFFLSDPVSRGREIDAASASMGEPLELVLEGHEARLSLHGGEAGKINEAVYQITARSLAEALEIGRRDLEARLSRWALQMGRGASVAGWRVADPTHGAVWRCAPFRPSALDLDPAALDSAPPEAAPFLELYRRARNASDPAWRLLCACGILRAWRAGEAPFDAGFAQRRVGFQDLLQSGALVCAGDLRDQPLEALMTRLEALRGEILRMLEAPGEAASFSPAASESLAQMANLADLLAREGLRGALGLKAGAPAAAAAS
ncbi:methylamine utilization protein MauJ [Neomegalonema sp.]|uniref:methylamine utilization protein MauJ n=1 Tax=Neomegalonema sp. TaxID=2039713 RepID=UPI002631B2AC|nr:methylamine utilization protein MauJ [Neomegalonema sp.]MDD2867341.1 methylamine utilization protein MauJ [Neomegalonema sp.]